MILALDKHSALSVFTSTEEAETYLEAIDVQQDVLEFCDFCGRRYSVSYTKPPKVSKFGPIGFVDIGEFKLVADGGIDPGLPEGFMERAAYIVHTSVPSITSIEELRNELRKQIS